MIAKSLPVILFLAACLAAAFGYGMIAGRNEHLPFRIASDALQTGKSLWGSVARDQLGGRVPTDMPADDVAKHWVSPSIEVNDGAAFLIAGGTHNFLQYCPEYGCAAVILDRKEELIHAYPFRPFEFSEKRIVELEYEVGFFDPAGDIHISGHAILPNGDPSVVLDLSNAFPDSGGIARLDKDGHVVWYRQDYSHHWPWITADSDILASTSYMEHRPVFFSLDKRKEATFPIHCEREGLPKDAIQVLNQNGVVKDEISFFDEVMKGPYRARFLLRREDATCDPVHTNSVVLVGPALASKFPDVSADDLLISSRGLDALFILGRKNHQIKHMIVGTFRRQHSAKPLPDGRIILFDNMGSPDENGPTRVLIIDPATNQEITLFPNALTPPTLDIVAGYLGRIELSPDGKSVVVAFGPNGKGYEIRLADDAILTTLTMCMIFGDPSG